MNDILMYMIFSKEKTLGLKFKMYLLAGITFIITIRWYCGLETEKLNNIT